MRNALLAATLLLALGACDDKEHTATALTITVTADEGAEPVVMKLRCFPPGGDHPQAKQACDAINVDGIKSFDPVPADQACTMIYGGPQVATVVGTYKGIDVDTTFSRTNGCEIDRWEKLGTTVFDVPLQ
ncbi:hypothetical protein J2X11_001282 [Aeromicrobium panaciterrae]|uniref:Subtilisin inhibitor domain-containing protein n=1 Tax=Aeromicrobium panaciterrae TaxID=363861 RepID=A0ABU1UMQ1_9ACTN|nr:SSI family serine proteinase inhibitor [Aeromicrobium panaciterrae]MDR7086443.1 hypothetical protein [Aeromicrobium panaciterrae]